MRVRQQQCVAWRELDGRAVLVDPREGKVTVLNPCGSRLWALIETPTELEELVGRIVDRYGIAHERAVADVTSFVEGLRVRDLVIVEESASPRPEARHGG